MGETGSAVVEYTTLAGDHQAELEVKRSRFLTYLRRTSTEAQAREFIAELRRRHFDARHHCSAFLLGPDRVVQRSSDDGEPSATAGLPMLEALLKREMPSGACDLSDVTAVVVRYFGGVLLGAGGLVRAYSQAVSGAMDSAGLLARRRMAVFSIDAPHAEAGRWENELRQDGTTVLGTDYGPLSATLRVAVPDGPTAAHDFTGRLATLTAGAGTAVDYGTEWTDIAVAGHR